MASLPPPPPLRATPPVRTFIVFFDANAANLTPDARSVISQAVKTARMRGAVRIAVTGYTVNSESGGLRLSQGRADAVKREMIRDGMRPSDIIAIGRAIGNPVDAETADDREALSRRAVIDLGR
jgi:outer membrane protein OmpA-like peptidoglycan-associated protein